ncbi:MAG: hypothetical protein PHF86_06800 [Candidatus Nanoarchaeia archaeon]|jgi:hypothetical protein|nr:hypothetical protein [Candidatus Nanoarchaeia archaeon]
MTEDDDIYKILFNDDDINDNDDEFEGTDSILDEEELFADDEINFEQ